MGLQRGGVQPGHHLITDAKPLKKSSRKVTTMPQLTPGDINDIFAYAAPEPAEIQIHTDLSTEFMALATSVNEAVPDGRCKAECIELLEAAKMWASKAIAFNQNSD